jgi:hypothetical protein
VRIKEGGDASASTAADGIGAPLDRNGG